MKYIMIHLIVDEGMFQDQHVFNVVCKSTIFFTKRSLKFFC